MADSQIERMRANLESMNDLRINLKEQGFEVEKIPLVIQYDQRDLPNAAPLDEMKRLLDPMNVVDFEARAQNGEGVFDVLEAVATGVLSDLKHLSR